MQEIHYVQRKDNQTDSRLLISSNRKYYQNLEQIITVNLEFYNIRERVKEIFSDIKTNEFYYPWPLLKATLKTYFNMKKIKPKKK